MGSTAGNYLIFLPVFRIFRQRYPKITTNDTDICIDGYPRSGNTYFVSAFLSWNDGLLVRKPVLNAIATEAYPLPTPRPQNSCLDTAKLKKWYGRSVPNWRDALSQVIRENSY